MKKIKKKYKGKKISKLNWFLGYHELSIPRSSCEDFLNLCLRYGFEYFGLKINEEEKRATFFVRSLEYKDILTACRLWQIRVKSEGFYGFPSKMLKYRGRWGIAVGAVLSLALFLLSQSVVWRIDVIGNERLSDERIIESLSQNGLSVGDWISQINANSVEQRVMINDEEVAWMSINFTGTVARVEVREIIDTEIVKPSTRPANIVSLYDAQIVSLEVYSGFVCVKEGDFVREGELIVSGLYKTEKAPIRYLRASARVLARVTRTFEVEIPLIQQQKVPTGEKIDQKTLNFFGNSIKLFTNYRNLPSTCDIINYIYTFNPLSLGELPISVETVTYLPYTLQEVEISESEAIEQAYALLRQRIDEELPEAQILNKTLYGEFRDGKYVLRCKLTAVCNVARQIEFEVLK